MGKHEKKNAGLMNFLEDKVHGVQMASEHTKNCYWNHTGKNKFLVAGVGAVGQI